MNLFVMYNKKSRPSARALADAIKEGSSGLEVARGVPESKLLRRKLFDFVLNVGNSTQYKFSDKTTVINEPQKISTSANKRLARMRFKARRISAPALWLYIDEIPLAEYPVIGRTTYHMKAKGFWFCRTPAEATIAMRRGATHFIKFIDNTREFRAHVFASALKPTSKDHYVIGKLSEKKGSIDARDTIIKNHDHGYVFVAPSRNSEDVLNKVRALAKETVFKFGLHYGGVDILYSLNTGKVYVLEINTTPCLTDDNSTTIEVYRDKFIELIGATHV